MKRYRVKAVGLGLALWAGHGPAAGVDPPARSATAPAMLPAALRTGDQPPAAASELTPLWLPARMPGELPLLPPTVSVLPSVIPAGAPVVPIVVPPAVSPSPEPHDLEARGPRLNPGSVSSGSLPDLPAIPIVPASPSP